MYVEHEVYLYAENQTPRLKAFHCKYFFKKTKEVHPEREKLDNAKRGIPSQGGKVDLDL